jgi:putative endonuclease
MGMSGELAAGDYLQDRGYRVLGRNLRVPMGEADLLCEAPDRRTIVLVEVKTRSTDSTRDGHRPPELSVHQRKRRTLTRILRYLCAANRWNDRPTRIDVVAVELNDGRVARIRHHPDAVRDGHGRSS